MIAPRITKCPEETQPQTVDDIIARWIEKKLVEDQVNSALNRLYESGMTDSALTFWAGDTSYIGQC